MYEFLHLFGFIIKLTFVYRYYMLCFGGASKMIRGILHYFWTILILLIGPSWSILEAQNTPNFKSHKLEEIASKLSAYYHVDFGASQVYALNEKPLIVTIDNFHTIDHIGFKLFDRAVMEQNPSPIYHFVERFLLELFLMKDNSKISEYLQESKIILRFGQTSNKGVYHDLLGVLSKISPGLSIIMTTDNNRYTISWFQNNRLVFSLRFPIQYELLWGMNKAESENHFYSDLLAFRSVKNISIPSDTLNTSFMKAINDSCFRASGDYYGIEEITSDQYYQKTSKGKLIQLSDLNNPVESVLNLFTMKADKRITAAVVQRLYGGRKVNFDITLSQLLDFCRVSGCEIYAGVEALEGNAISGTVMMVNRALGYNHLLSFSTDIRVISNPDKYKMDIQLFTFVPIHNINTLYNEQTIKKSTK